MDADAVMDQTGTAAVVVFPAVGGVVPGHGTARRLEAPAPDAEPDARRLGA